MDKNKTNIVLAVDIGSTRTHAAAVDVRALTCGGNICFDNAEFDALFMPSVKKIAAAYPQIRKINISSCVKKLADKARDICGGEKLFDDVTVISAQSKEITLNPHDTPRRSIRINYDAPGKLGTDRLSNALACAALFAGEDCVIVDAGTAITVDVLRGGRVFEGGAILPGLSMQFDALHKGTDSLPVVKIHDGNDTDPIGTSTADCIRIGVMYGSAGAIERLANEYGGRTIITGGDGKALSQLIRRDTITIPDLTLIGTGIF